jgi:hypothetical protein
MKAKPLPTLEPATGWQDAPFRCLTSGCDTYAETWNVVVGEVARAKIEGARARAAEQVHGDGKALLELGGEEWLVASHGAKGGVIYLLEGADMLVMFRAWSTEWNCTVRYLSAGIWKTGLPALRERAAAFLDDIGALVECPDNPRVSRFDYAVDAHAPGWRPSYGMADQWVFPQGQSKLRMTGTLQVIGRSVRPQTFTLGRIDGLQVQLYDKVAEIRDASGKKWFFDLWGVSEDVWRVECRFGSQWMKDRGLRTYEQVKAELRPLLATALSSYRLTDGAATRARRSAVHPLWWRVMERAGRADMGLAEENLCGLRREEFAAMMHKTAVGVLRSRLVALHGEVTPAALEEMAAEIVKAEAIDPNRSRKIQRLRERHRWIGENAS